MGIQVIAPGGYVREHLHTPNQEILFCLAGKGTVIVDGVPRPFVPGTTVYAAPGVRHKIINDGTDELKDDLDLSAAWLGRILCRHRPSARAGRAGT
jgi:quercetin dioxygenase-like cupin family protein